ncbi:MAG: SHOCT domain-containing protein [FCB group bacterium]|nr:SHOCT domain-containing protein [FCB group bacterium]
MHSMNLFGGGFMMVFWWGLVIVLVLAVFRWFQGQSTTTPGRDSAEDILKKRYAKGEISKTEYEIMKKELE